MTPERSEISAYTLALVMIFISLFLHTIFLFNDDIALMQIVDNDAGVIANSILQLFNSPIYNQHNGYYSQYYGWVFNDINFIFILIAKLLGQFMSESGSSMFSSEYTPSLLWIIRATNFTMGLISVLLFFNLSKLLFKNELLSFVATLFFMVHPIGNQFLYSVAPDSTAMVFSLIATLYLIKFSTEQDARYFYISYVSLILSALSKPIFLLTTFPVLVVFFLIYCHRQNLSYRQILLSKIFAQIAGYCMVTAIGVLLLVHPYAILEFSKFYANQQYLIHQELNSGLLQSFHAWSVIYQNSFLLMANIALSAILVIGYLVFKKMFGVSMLFLMSILYCGIFVPIFLMYSVRVSISTTYLYPILPLLILNIVAVMLFISKRLASLPKANYWQFAFFVGSAIYLLPVLWMNTLAVTNKLLDRMSYTNTTYYQARKFVSAEIPKHSSVLYDPIISMPKKHQNGCSMWVCAINHKVDFIVSQQNNEDAQIQNINEFTRGNVSVLPTTVRRLISPPERFFLHKSYVVEPQFRLIKKFHSNIEFNFSADLYGQIQKLIAISSCGSRTGLKLAGPDILVYRNQASHLTKAEEQVMKEMRDAKKMADIFYKLRNWEKAKEKYLQYIDLAESIGDWESIVASKFLLVDIYEKQQIFATALELVNQLIDDVASSGAKPNDLYSTTEQLYRKRIFFNQKLNNNINVDKFSVELAEFYINCYSSREKECIDALRKNLPDLLVRIEQAYLKKIEVLSRGPNYTEQFLAADYSVLGQFYTSINNWEKSISIYKKTIGIYDSLGDKVGLFNAYSALAATYGMASSSAPKPESDEDIISVGIGLEENMRQELNTRLQMIDLCKTMTIVSCDLTRLKNEHQNVLLLYQLLGDEAQARKIENDLNLIEK